MSRISIISSVPEAALCLEAAEASSGPTLRKKRSSSQPADVPAQHLCTSFGMLGIGGIVAMALGSFFLFEEAPGFELSPAVVLTASLVSAGVLILVLETAFRAHRRQIVTDDIIGSRAEVLTWAGGSGLIHVHGERWKARSSKPLRPGVKVHVRGRDKLVLDVEPEPDPPQEP